MSTPERPIIDVEQIVEDIRARLEHQRAAGAYSDDLSGITLEVSPAQEDGSDVDAPRVRFRPELGFSTKRVIGPVITLFKQFLLKLLFFVFDDLAKQVDTAIRRIEIASTVESGARAAGDELLDARLVSEIGAREAVAHDVVEASNRLAETHQHLERLHHRLERLQLESRLARLERARRAPLSAPSGPARPPVVEAPAFDYERFEDRFRPEASVRERQQAYVDLMRGKRRVVDLGCGRGELLRMLRDEGVSAYGVEIDPDFIALLEENEIEVVAKDAVAHMAELEPWAVDGIVGSHLVEHLPPAAVSQLVALAGEKLAEEGLLILETPNPESLVAGSINFHRDLTHIRPIHPDTLAFLCESSGFSSVEIRRLSPVPDDERLPLPGDGRLDVVVDQLNELLYGFQDYAVVARR